MTEKIAIVTGAGTGVGRAAALALMREGYTVVLAGRRQEMLDAVAKEGAQTPGAALIVQTDIADPASDSGHADHANARRVYAALSAKKMPPDGAWPQDWLDTYQNWMDTGFQP